MLQQDTNHEFNAKHPRGFGGKFGSGTGTAKTPEKGEPRHPQTNETRAEYRASAVKMAKARGATDDEAERIADAVAHRSFGNATATPNARERAAAPKPAESKPEPTPARSVHVQARDPKSLTDDELDAATEEHVRRATDAISKGDEAGHAAHSDRVETLQREQERRAEAKKAEKEKARKAAEKPAEPKPAAEPGELPVPEAKDTTPDAPAEPEHVRLAKRLQATLGNVGEVRGLDGESFKNATEADDVDPADTLRRAKRVADDMDRVMSAHPRIAELAKAGPRIDRVTFAHGENLQGGAWRSEVKGAYFGGLNLPFLGKSTIRSGFAQGQHLKDSVLAVASVPGDEQSLALGKGRHFMAEGPSAPAVFRHEFGHHMERVVPDARKAFGKLYKAKSRKEWAASVSTYGASSASELWAESFAAFTHPDYGEPGQPRLPAEIHDLFTQTFGARK